MIVEVKTNLLEQFTLIIIINNILNRFYGTLDSGLVVYSSGIEDKD